MTPAESDNGFTIDEEEDGFDWIVTYADLMTLLLVFFVLLFSISSLDMVRFKASMASIQVSLGESTPAMGLMEFMGGDGILDKPTRIDEIIGIRSRQQEILAEIAAMITQRGMGDRIEVFERHGAIVIHIRGAVLFDSAMARLTDEGRPILEAVGLIIEKFSEYKVNIKGHTDNVPIATRRFPSNWDLSAIRATTVLKYLIHRGIDPRRLTATGYGDLMPVADNLTPQGRAKNRRVEFVLQNQKETR